MIDKDFVAVVQKKARIMSADIERKSYGKVTREDCEGELVLATVEALNRRKDEFANITHLEKYAVTVMRHKKSDLLMNLFADKKKPKQVGCEDIESVETAQSAEDEVFARMEQEEAETERNSVEKALREAASKHNIPYIEHNLMDTLKLLSAKMGVEEVYNLVSDEISLEDFTRLCKSKKALRYDTTTLKHRIREAYNVGCFNYKSVVKHFNDNGYELPTSTGSMRALMSQVKVERGQNTPTKKGKDSLRSKVFEVLRKKPNTTIQQLSEMFPQANGGSLGAYRWDFRRENK